MNSRSASEWARVFGEVFHELTSRGFKPKLPTMDHEASEALKNYFTEQDMTYQLVPPHYHRRNASERAIRTFKEHFVSGLASVDPDFPMHLWDRLLHQAEMSLNLLRTSRLHAQLSAAAHLHGLVDYNKTAFAPPGCKIIAHENPSQRRTWEPHGQPGYSLGPEMHHYRCQNMYTTSTASERIVDTLEFFPHNSPMPQISSTDRVLMAAQYMTDALKHPHPDVPFATIGDETIMALTTLATIFKSKFQKPLAPEVQNSPLKTAENKRPAALIQQALTSPARPMYQTRSQTVNPTDPAHVIQSPNSSLPPRVVTPAARSAAPPRVPARVRNLSPRNLSQGDFLDTVSANHAIKFGNNHWTTVPTMNAVLHPATGKKCSTKTSRSILCSDCVTTKDLEMNLAACAKASVTSRAPVLASFLK
jgi:hypothetical protein